MVYSPVMGGFKLSAQDMGAPDYAQALQKGFQTAADVYKPRLASEKLLEQMIKNKFLPRSEEARIGNQEAHTGLLGQQSKYYGPNIQSEMDLRSTQQDLYKSQIKDAEWKQRLKDIYLNNSGGVELNNMDMGDQSQPENATPRYANNMRDSIGTPSSPMQNIPPFVRKALGLPEEFPEEKMNREISTSRIEEQNKQEIKRAQVLRDTAKDLSLAGMDINGIHDILTGPDSLSTGITRSLVGKLGFGSEKLGALNERALRLQAQMARALSSKGGAGAANIVASGKPSSWKSTSENLGITDAYAERIGNEFEMINKEYKAITGKNLPYTLPEYVHNIGKKIEEHSFKPKNNFSSEKEYHDYMQALNPEQRTLALKAQKAARGESK
jgi:hypothetical protein